MTFTVPVSKLTSMPPGSVGTISRPCISTREIVSSMNTDTSTDDTPNVNTLESLLTSTNAADSSSSASSGLTQKSSAVTGRKAPIFPGRNLGLPIVFRVGDAFGATTVKPVSVVT